MAGLPSVTQVLRPYSDFSGIPEDVLENAARRGSLVHRYCAGSAQGLWTPFIDSECAGYVESFRRWFGFVDEVHMAEVALVDERLGFRGTPDLVVTLRGDGHPSLWDLKTPRTPARGWVPQVAAYQHLATQSGMCPVPIRRAGCVRLNPDGGPPIIDEYDLETLLQAFRAFMGALSAWRFFNNQREEEE